MTRPRKIDIVMGMSIFQTVFIVLVCVSAFIKSSSDGESSNGRTSAFEAENLGPIPSSPANMCMKGENGFEFAN